MRKYKHIFDQLGLSESTSSNDLGVNYTLNENDGNDLYEIKIHIANSDHTNEDLEQYAYHIITHGQELLINYLIDDIDELFSIIKSNRELLSALQKGKDSLEKITVYEKQPIKSGNYIGERILLKYGIAVDVSDDGSDPIIETYSYWTEKDRDQAYRELKQEQRNRFGGEES